MKLLLPLVLSALLLAAGCGSPSAKTETLTPAEQNLRRTTYDDFVGRRALELEKMGGPFKDKKVAMEKALTDAEAVFGTVPSDWSVKWKWGQGSKDQATLNADLDRLARSRRQQ